MTDWLTWQQPGSDTDQMRKYLVTALARSGLCITLQDSKLGYVFIANLFDRWADGIGSVPDDIAIFGSSVAESLFELKSTVLDTGRPGHIEIADGTDGAFEFNVECIAVPNGQTMLLTRIVDLSDRRVAERVTKSLLREVSHRSKNLLAIVQSIAFQTARHTDSTEEFLKEFRGRVHSLSRAQDLVTESSWRGARLHDLIERQAEKYIPEGAASIQLEGDNVSLAPNAVMHIGLALHELIVKAAADGALDSTDRPVTVECSNTIVDGQNVVQINWHEQAAGNDPSSQEPGFGRVLLERVVPASVNGRAQLKAGRAGTNYQIIFPATAENIESH